MDGRVFAALIWKHFLVRKRRFIMTILEYLLPVALFVLTFVIGNVLFAEPQPKHAKQPDRMDIQTPEPLMLNNAITPKCIFFTPDTDINKLLMASVGTKLNINERKLYQFSGRCPQGYYAFSEMSQIAPYIASENMSPSDAVIIFDGAYKDLPGQLKYTIRMKEDFMTQMEMSMDSNLVPHQSFGTIYDTFMRLQWAIDTSFLEHATGNEVNQSVTLQEFPFVHRFGGEMIEIMVGISCFVFLSGLYITFVLQVSKLVGENLNGVQELMKMSGVSTLTLGLVNLLDTLPGMLVFAIAGAVTNKVGVTPILANSDGFLLFLILFLHACTLFAVGYVVSYAIRTEQHAQLLSIIAYTSLALVGNALVDKLPAGFQYLAFIWPFVPMMWVGKRIYELEKYGVGLTFRTLASSGNVIPAAGLAMVFMLVQTALYLLIAWYLDHVFPGKFGHALPWNFLFKAECKSRTCEPPWFVRVKVAVSNYGLWLFSRKSSDTTILLNDKKQYWRKNGVEPSSEYEEDSEQGEAIAPQQYFEAAPAHADVGIKVVNITKIYPKHRALNNVSLDIYRGELTVLLGHNGAGKTTLMSIMTGTLQQTTGRVYVNGQDISVKQDARKQIGFCPQHNMFFPKLSVIEHVVIFSILRGQTRAEAWKSAARLLEQLGLEAKASSLAHELSGGMKRRLQLACALAGDADVLVLDEPSSGLDVETRRSLWDLILALRGRRTVLISTHFMEEADALGDRVAALHTGRLRCHASPMFLKKAMGTGYRLTLVTSSSPNEAGITGVVRSAVPDATLKEATINSVSYALPATASHAFPGLFTALEANKADLGVDSIGVGVSTLEEVFLALCSDTDTTNSSQDEMDGVSRIEPTYQVIRGCRLWCRQLYELVLRQIFYLVHIKYSFLIGQVFFPIALIALLATQTNNHPDMGRANATARPVDLGSFDPHAQYRVLYRADRDTAKHVEAVSKLYPAVTFEQTHDVAAAVLNSGKKDILEYHKYLAGIEIDGKDAKVLYTTTVRHAAPAALSLLANVVARGLAGASGAVVAVTTVNHPLDTQRVAPQHPGLSLTHKNELLTTIFVIFVAFLILVTLASAASLPILERISGARWIHVMAGCAPELYWAVHLLFRTVLVVVTLVVPVLIVCACDPDNTLSEPVFIGALGVILVLGSMAFLMFVFLFSFFCTEMMANVVLCIVITLNLVFTATAFLEPGFWKYLSILTLHLMPGQALVDALRRCGVRAGANAACALNRHLCPGLGLAMPGCCDSTTNMKCYFCIYDEAGDLAPGHSMVLLFVQLLFYVALVLMTQRNIVSWCRERVKALRYSPTTPRYDDEMVRAERAYVNKAIDLPPRQISDTMLVSDVHKSFGIFRPFSAIKGISFSVKKGECLGLLGVNGAGKSSTFRVLTAEDWATRGRVFSSGHHREGFSTDYVQRLGYCPQFFGLDAFLSGRRNLALLFALKGLDDRDAREETNEWIRIVGLERYASRPVGGYSGGCQRRLGAAAALGLGAALSLLDEPTAGVDVAARRRVWAALRRGLAGRRAVIITSHSMDEMEALCHRIAIMSAGEVCALGSPGELRARHAAGHAVVLKVRAPARGGNGGDETDAASTPLNQLKGTLMQTFNCTLKDEHKTMLHYHINETLPYSVLFSELERLKNSFPEFVEDYSVTETTLEEVFLSFAKPDEPVEANGTGLRRRGPETRAVPV